MLHVRRQAQVGDRIQQGRQQAEEQGPYAPLQSPLNTPVMHVSTSCSRRNKLLWDIMRLYPWGSMHPTPVRCMGLSNRLELGVIECSGQHKSFCFNQCMELGEGSDVTLQADYMHMLVTLLGACCSSDRLLC